MKVLLLAEWLHHMGGCETFLTTVCDHLPAFGIEASLFVATQPVHERWRAAFGERLTEVTEGDDPLNALMVHIERTRPDLIHAVPLDRTAVRLAGLTERPVLVGTEASDGSERCHWPSYGPALAAAFSHFDAIHCFSARAEANIARVFGYAGPTARTPPLCAFPADLPLWSRRTPSRRLAAWGRISTEKGWSFLVESLAVLRRSCGPLELDLWGTGPFMPMLEQLVASCGERGRVRLLGGFEDPFALPLQDYDAALVPSFFEGLPYSLLEAWWRGIPAVMTRFSGAPDLVADGPLCRFFDPGDQGQLAAALGALYLDYPALAGHAAARRAVVAQACTPAAVLPVLIELYRRALAADRGARIVSEGARRAV